MLGAIAFVGLIAALIRFSDTGADLIICVICLGGIALCLLDVLIVTGAGLWFRFRKEAPPNEEPMVLEVGQPIPTGFNFGQFGRIPLLLFKVEWKNPSGVDASFVDSNQGLLEQARAEQRGHADKVVREITIQDWFGLSRVRFERVVEQPIRLLPGCGSRAQFELMEQFKPGDILGHPEGEPIGDFVEMRRYVAGDPLKLVLWKVYARTGNLLVRTAERAVAPTDRMMAYFVPGPGDEPTAGIARAAIEQGLLGHEVIFMAEGAPQEAESPAESVDQIIRSVNHCDQGGEELDRFLVRGEAVGTTAAFLFVPPALGPWLLRVYEAIEKHRGPFEIIIGIDGLRKTTERSRWKNYLFQPDSHQLACPVELGKVCERLAATGATLRVLNRQTGEPVNLN